MPLATWLGWSQAPGDVPGFGPLDADDSRHIAALLAASPASKWCITLTDPAGQPVAHGCARTSPGHHARPGTSPRDGPANNPSRASPQDNGWIRQVKITPLETGTCTHHRESRAYQPAPALRHLIQIRNATCISPICRRSAFRADLDHTIPHHLGGRTCECNLGPACRRDHQVKHSPGWTVVQPQPGVFIWTTPGRRSYRTGPTIYAT
jgi:hypothetical protein